MSKYKWPSVAICGKFQGFHKDHLNFVQTSLEIGEHLIIGITNPDPSVVRPEQADPERSKPDSNPFTYYERYLMILESLRDAGINHTRFDIVPFPINIQELWFHYIPGSVVFLTTIYENDEWLQAKRRKLEKGGYRVEVVWNREKKLITGSQVRHNIRTGKHWEHFVPAGTSRVIHRMGLHLSLSVRTDRQKAEIGTGK